MRIKKMIAGFLAAVMFQSGAMVVSAEENTSASFVYDDFSVNYEIKNSYGDTDVVDVTLTNTGEETIEDWMLYFDPNGEIQYVTNASEMTADNGSMYFKSKDYNADIAPNSTVTFTYAVNNCTEIPDYYALCQSRIEKTSGYDVSINVNETWGNSFNGSIVINNNTNEPIEAWELTVDTNFSITEITNSWAATVTELDNYQYKLKGTYTSTIDANSSVSLGFIGVKSSEPEIADYYLTEIKPLLYDEANSLIDLSANVKKLSTVDDNSIIFYAESDLEVNGIELRSNDSNSLIAVMKDDGDIANNGDEYMNDGVYSCVVDVDNSSVGNLSFYAACVNVTSEDVIIPIYQLFTKQELDDMDAVDAAIQNLINTDSFATENEKISDINSLLLSLAENNDDLGYALIQNNSICYSTEGKIFEFKYACGVEGVIDLSDNEGKDNGTINQTETEVQDNIISSAEGIYGTALLMDGFERDAFRDNYYNNLKNELDSAGLATDLVMDVTISDLENMENHDFIGICMHGSYPQNGHIVLCTQERVTAEKNQLYAYELQLGIVKRSSHYWYTEGLIEEFYDENSFEGSIIYLQNCMSLGKGSSSDTLNYSMANALINCGADTVIGNFNSIRSTYNQMMMKKFVEELLSGCTTSTALSNCKDNYGYDDGDGDGIIDLDGGEYEAVTYLVGDTTKYLINQNIQNGSFESQFNEWQCYGDVSTKLRLGNSIKPISGRKMAFITTKTNEYNNSGIYQTFKIPNYASTLTFTYDVISEEPLEWVNEGYNDTFTAKLISTTSEDTLAIESTDTSEWTRVTDVNLPCGDNTTYHTGTITIRYDVRELRGSNVKLVFDVQDSGDNTFDTAVVIDNVSLTK